jgi:hypothetical protein
VFPGHYGGRATHVHVMARNPVVTNSDNTVSGNEWDNNVHHIGQIYFEEALRSAVESTDPYTSNTQQYLSNDGDPLAAAQASSDYDPLVNYFFVNGQDVSGELAY